MAFRKDKKLLSEKEDRVLDQINIFNKEITKININKNKQISDLKTEFTLANPQLETKQRQVDEERQILKEFKSSSKSIYTGERYFIFPTATRTKSNKLTEPTKNC